MICDACAVADENTLTGLYQTGCKACSARKLAQSIEYARARIQGKLIPEYIAALHAVYGEGWQAGHFEVKQWSKRIACAKAKV
jgi:hypothetical protein